MPQESPSEYEQLHFPSVYPLWIEKMLLKEYIKKFLALEDLSNDVVVVRSLEELVNFEDVDMVQFF